MKGRLKDRIKQFTLVGLFLFISVLTISLIVGRVSTEKIILVKKNGIDISKNLEEQLEYFEVVEISSSEYKYFKNSIVTSLKDLNGYRLVSELQAGSPIPKDALVDPQGAGVFASKMPKGRTVHLLSEALYGLPPVQPGDKINILLSYSQKNDEGVQEIHTGLLMEEVPVYKVTDTSIYIDVSIEEDLILQTAKQLGTFFYQIPGQDNEDENSVYEYETAIDQNDVFEAILNQTYSHLSLEEKQDLLDKINNNLVVPNEETSEEATDETIDEDGGAENNEQ